jgi:TRAP-type mannitol/chloroaromatic compound transport system permease large subunit
MAWLGFLMFAVAVLVLLAGYPVAFSLAGTALIFAFIGSVAGVFDPVFLDTMPNRIFGVMSNVTLIAVPLFVFMGVTLERAKIAEDLLESLSMLMGRVRGGLGIAVILVGMLMAASTGSNKSRLSRISDWRLSLTCLPCKLNSDSSSVCSV